jgi:hypothetical protein
MFEGKGTVHNEQKKKKNPAMQLRAMKFYPCKP